LTAAALTTAVAVWTRDFGFARFVEIFDFEFDKVLGVLIGDVFDVQGVL
jgi:hypothetical protein